MFGNHMITVTNISDAIAMRTVIVPVCDISVPTIDGYATYYALGDQDCDIGIESVSLIYRAAAGGAAGQIDIGTPTDADAIVDAHATSITAVAGTTETCTLADTLRSTVPKTGGRPVLPAGTPLLITSTIGAGNTGDFNIVIKYFNIEPGV